MDEIATGLYRLGDPRFPAFIVRGRHGIVQVDAGPVVMGPVYLKEIRELLGEKSGRPDFIFHTHYHFDHVGSTPFLQRHFPGIILGGSEKFVKRLSRTTIRNTTTDLNRALVRKSKMDGVFIPGDFDYGTLKVDRILSDGERIDLGGGSTIEVIATPGHTPDSLSFFLPHIETVLAGDAVGIIPGDDFRVTPQFLSSYEDYLGSIERVRKKSPEIIVLGHHAVVRKGQCQRFFNAAVDDCRAFRQMIEQYLKEAQMKEETVIRRIQVQEYHRLGRSRQPEAAYLLNLAAQVRLIAKDMISLSGIEQKIHQTR